MRVILLAGLLGALSAPGLAASDTIDFEGPQRRVAIDSLRRDGRVYVSVGALVNAMGGKVGGTPKNLWLNLPPRRVLIETEKNRFFVPLKKDRPGKKISTPPHALPDPAVIFNGRCYLSLDSLPIVLDRRFSFHLQKQLLSEVTDTKKEPEKELLIRTRHTTREGKVWVSLHDVAQALGVPVYSQESGRYLLVLPDFTLLTLVTGDVWVFRRQQRYRPMEDALLTFSGIPHISLPSLAAVFETEAVWDAQRQVLKIPHSYGRLRTVDIAPSPLQIEGYRPEPFRVNLDYLSIYDQHPAPLYYAPHEDPYESVRDFITNEPEDSGATGWDRLSGQVRLSAGGAFLGQPTEGGATFEKTGTRARLSNGALQWGFPRFQVRGAREYLKLGDFEKQTVLTDFVTASASNDTYGEGEASPEWKVAALYGENEFSVFLSTEYFSQSVKFRQRVSGGRLALDVRDTDETGLRMTLSELRFDNRPLETVNSFNYFADLFGDDFDIPVDPTAAGALTQSFLTDHHSLTLLDLQYTTPVGLDLVATGGMSRYRDPAKDDATNWGQSWRLRTLYRHRGSRVDISREQASLDYRSLGDPLQYRNLGVTRVNTYLDIRGPWKIQGDLRRENSGGHPDVGLPGYRFDYGSAGNLLYLPGWSNRTLGSYYNHTLYGKRWKVDNDYTKYLGRHAVDLGGAWASQWLNTGALYKQSYTGRFTIRYRPGQRLYSLGPEITKHHYPQRRVDLWESVTRVEVQGPRWKTLASYGSRPLAPPSPSLLTTASLRVERRWGQQTTWALFGSTAGQHATLDSPAVWRVGVDYTRAFY